MNGRTNSNNNTTGFEIEVPLDPVTNVSASAGDGQVELTWTDPLDKYAATEGEVAESPNPIVSQWDHTRVVRKENTQPTGPNDGVIILTSDVRNQYQSTSYVDSGLTNDTLYHYGLFACNTAGLFSAGAFGSATPKAGTPLSQLSEGSIIKILENGSPVEFYLAKHNYEPELNGEGRELIVRKSNYTYDEYGRLGTTNYIGRTLDTWCNTTYTAMFSQDVQELMGETIIISVSKYGTTSNISRKAFALSMTELGVDNFLYAIKEGSVLPTAGTLRALGDHQWTRTISENPASNSACFVDEHGYADDMRTDTGRGYRPAFTLSNLVTVNSEMVIII